MNDILLTGFAPWGSNRINPSGEVAAELGGVVLPVDYAAAARDLRKLIRSRRPCAVLMLGLAESRTRISLEALALNVDHSEEQRIWRRTIRKGGPPVLESTLPLKRLQRALKAARIPVAVSHHAGTFVCNRVFYEGLSATDVPCGFVHVPPFKALSRALQIRAVEILLRELGGSSPAATR